MYAVIMAGGSGTRFWPASRTGKPKQFLNITGKGPMVLETCDRLIPGFRDEEMILILGDAHRVHAQKAFKGRNVHMVSEPVGRNTAPCMGLGAIYADYLGCEDPVAFLPADHFIGKPQVFLEALQTAGALARRGGIVTLGIVPTRPETGFGYIRRAGKGIGVGGLQAYRVAEFAEKPPAEKAQEYVNSGRFYWNAGIFVASPKTILKEIKAHLPALHDGLKVLSRALGTDAFRTELEAVYERIEGVSFDHGVMEKTGETLYVLPCSCGWSDVGSWSSLYDLRQPDYDGLKNLSEGETFLIDCEGSFVSGSGGRLVACLGLKNCLVVDTPDALLVADMDRAQDIRRLVDLLKKNGKAALL